MSKDSGKTPNPNDQRSDTKNPNNPAQKASQDNRSNQMNPNRHQQNTPQDGNSSSPNTGNSSGSGGNQRKS
ncbi:hypothetical protein [Pyxidicoccus trucidator]|uniref:hypothetical protein n=1 Tax=Pyxidicoccus trucidator TaxID=2709662 RepID=UPI0013D9617F|nr:hypothetical protein [Pyxidicoccus trucidator]